MLLLSDNYYLHLLREYGGEKFQSAYSTAQKLENKLKASYGDRICILSGNTKSGNIVYSASSSIEEAIRRQDTRASDLKIKVRDVALALRE